MNKISMLSQVRCLHYMKACLHYNVNKGSTQGSVSGPYLFILFINDLDLVTCPGASPNKYAKDTTM